MAAALEAGKQVLVLLPEIALTAQFLDRFEARFGTAPQEWHSDVPRAAAGAFGGQLPTDGRGWLPARAHLCFFLSRTLV